MFEQLYTDFTNKILPLISEGLVITKEYFTDLFGRYIKYLIITDLIQILGFLLMLTISTILIKKCIKNFKLASSNRDPDAQIGWFFASAGCIGGIIASILVIFNIGIDLTKAIYIPEIRIYEELRPIINKST